MLANQIVGRIWENGEFGFAFSKKMSVEPVAERLRTPEQAEHEEWIANLLGVHGAEAVLAHYGFDPLGFSPLPNSHTPVQRGLNGITSHGKRLVRNACRRLEKETDKSLLSFLTVTLPNVSYLESIAISQHWAEIVRVFLQRLKRALVRSGLSGEIVGVTEIQEKRTVRSGVLGLHLHLVFVGRLPKKGWALTPDQVKEYWQSALDPYLEESINAYDWSAVENIQRVLKSCEGYLGKYMSKGADQVRLVVESFGQDCLPRTWYSCTNSLRERVFARMRSVNDSIGRALVDACCDSESLDFHYRKPIILREEGGRDVVIGWFGRLREESINKFLSEREG